MKFGNILRIFQKIRGRKMVKILFILFFRVLNFRAKNTVHVVRPQVIGSEDLVRLLREKKNTHLLHTTGEICLRGPSSKLSYPTEPRHCNYPIGLPGFENYPIGPRITAGTVHSLKFNQRVMQSRVRVRLGGRVLSEHTNNNVFSVYGISARLLVLIDGKAKMTFRFDIGRCQNS